MSTPYVYAAGAVIALVTAFAMELWARLLHRSVWHERLWSVHRSHHSRRRGRFERNDLLSFLHAPIATALVMIGCNLHGLAAAACLGVGVGMTLFGIAYVVVHDGLVHGRLPVAFLARIPPLRRIRDAHAVHHARGAAPYGLFLGPRELMTRGPHARAVPPNASRSSDRAPRARLDTRPGGAPPSVARTR